MAEFSTTGTLDLQVSPGTLRDVERQIENGVEPTVNVSTTTGGSAGGSGGRQGDRIGRNWRDHLGLSRERNNLLRQLVDINEKDAQTTRNSGLGGGALGLAVGGVGLGSMLLGNLGSKIGDALPDLEPSDVISPVTTTATDVIDSAAEIDPADAIATAATVGPAALISAAATVAPGNVIDQLARINPGDVVGELAAIAPHDVIDNLAEIGPSDVVDELAEIGPGDVVAQLAKIGPGDVIATLAVINPGDVISAAVELAPDDIVSGTITAKDILNRVTEPDPSPSGDGGGGDTPWGIIAGGTAAAGAAAARYGSDIGNAVRGSGSKVATRTGGLPVALAEGVAADDPEGTMIGDTADGVFRTLERSGVDLPGNRPRTQNVNRVTAEEASQQASEREWSEHTIPDSESGPGSEPGLFDQLAAQALGQGAGEAVNYATQQQNSGGGSDGGQEVSAEQTNRFDITVPIDDLEREASQRFDEIDNRLNKLERAFDG